MRGQGSPSRRREFRSDAFTVIELVVVIGVLALLISILLPSLNRARERALKMKIASEERAMNMPTEVGTPKVAESVKSPARPLAQVLSFDAKVDMTPMLSVGTAEPESIYAANIEAKLVARGSAGECEIQLPLPPQIISLGDLKLLIDGVESDAVVLEGDRLVWHGPLPTAPTPVSVQYRAMGRGLFSLATPPGRIINQFKIELASNGSDVRMMELSLQPTSSSRGRDRTTYVSDYKRLMFGRPISLDVLGIAPVDRLGELSWLGPISVIAFGLVLGLISRAFAVANLDRWMLVLVLGTFTGAYPLMYFAQQFIPLTWAMVGAGALVLLIIDARVVSLMGWRLGIFGVMLPAACMMAMALVGAVYPKWQGIMLTALALSLFVLAMLLAPRMRVVRVASPLLEPAT